MQAIALRPQRRVLVSKQIALFVLAALIAAFPMVSLPLAMVMPLCSCPLIKGKEQWTAFVTAPLPALAVALRGYPIPYAVSLLPVVLVPLLLTLRLKPKDGAKLEVFLTFILAAALTLGLSLATIGLEAAKSGLNLPGYLAQLVSRFVMDHPQRTQLLYQALSSGFLPLPEGYDQVSMLTFTLDAHFLKQVELSLNSRLVALVHSDQPALDAEGTIIVGMFTVFRVQKLRNAYLLMDKEQPNQVRIARTPSFSMLVTPPHWSAVSLIFLVFSLLFFTSGGVLGRAAQLMYTTFTTVYQLIGAAAICTLMMHEKEERRVLAGIVATVLYLLLPFALFFLGSAHDAFHFHSQKDKNHSEDHKEEEP